MSKNVLLLLNRISYPFIGGDKVKSIKFIELLAKHYNLHLVIISNERINKETVEFFKKNNVRYKYFYKNKIRCALNTFLSLFNKLPLQVNYYYFKDVQNYVDIILKESQMAFATLIRTAKYLEKAEMPCYLDAVDSLALNYQNAKQKSSLPLWRILYRFEQRLLFKYEQRCIEHFSKTFFVNKYEAEYWSAHGKTVWIPNGVNESLFNYKKQDNSLQNSLAFFGKMSYPPNVDAVLWFLKYVFTRLDKEIRFQIVGGNPVKRIRNSEGERIKITGFLDDPYLILKSTFAVVAPMQIGGGIQNKVLEAMALGQVVITTPKAAKPIIGAINGQHLLIGKHPDEFVQLINDLYRNRSKYQDIGNNAKRLIQESYTWDKYEEKLLNAIQDE